MKGHTNGQVCRKLSSRDGARRRAELREYDRLRAPAGGRTAARSTSPSGRRSSGASLRSPRSARAAPCPSSWSPTRAMCRSSSSTARSCGAPSRTASSTRRSWSRRSPRPRSRSAASNTAAGAIRRGSSGSPGTSCTGRCACSTCRKVSESLRSSRQFRSDQGEIWDKVAELHCDLAVPSRTGAMRDVYEAKEGDLEGYLKSFKLAARPEGHPRVRRRPGRPGWTSSRGRRRSRRSSPSSSRAMPWRRCSSRRGAREAGARATPARRWPSPPRTKPGSS